MFARDPAKVDLDSWVDHVCNAITGPDLDQVILVGHSLAGITLPRVVDRLPDRILHVVYVACAIPPEGESVSDLVLGGQSLGPKVDGVDEATARTMFCNDMDERQTRYVLDHLGPEAGQPFDVPMDLAGLRHPVPRTFVKLLRDQSLLGPQRQDEIIERLRPVDVVELDTGHDVMISAPQLLAPVLNDIARRSGR